MYMALGSKGVGIMSEELADKQRYGAVEHHGGGGACGGGREARDVPLVLGVGASLVLVVVSCVKVAAGKLEASSNI
jgi:hypothetical protein